MKISKAKGTKVNFKVFVNSYKNGQKYLGQKGSYIKDSDGKLLDGIDPDKYYKVAGRGLNKEKLESLTVGEKIAVEGLVFGNGIKEETWPDGSIHYTVVVC